jgi:hypothetical protein
LALRSSGSASGPRLELGAQLDQRQQLVDEPRVDAGGLVDLLGVAPEPQRPLDGQQPQVVRHPGAVQRVLRRAGRVGCTQNCDGDCSSERIAFCRASTKDRPKAIASPTDFIVVVSSGRRRGTSRRRSAGS